MRFGLVTVRGVARSGRVVFSWFRGCRRCGRGVAGWRGCESRKRAGGLRAGRTPRSPRPSASGPGRFPRMRSTSRLPCLTSRGLVATYPCTRSETVPHPGQAAGRETLAQTASRPSASSSALVTAAPGSPATPRTPGTARSRQQPAQGPAAAVPHRPGQRRDPGWFAAGRLLAGAYQARPFPFLPLTCRNTRHEGKRPRCAEKQHVYANSTAMRRYDPNLR
jgi:hypothetical protein